MKSKRGLLIAAVVLVLVIALAGAAYTFLNNSSQQKTQNELSSRASGSSTTLSKSTSSSSLADFSVEDFEGNAVLLSNARGKPTIVGFWATWCPYCVGEAPSIQSLYDAYGDRVNFMMIDIADGKRETVSDAKKWLAGTGYTYPVYFDTSGKAANAAKAYYLPTTYILDSDGSIVSKKESAIDESTVKSTLDALLA